MTFLESRGGRSEKGGGELGLRAEERLEALAESSAGQCSCKPLYFQLGLVWCRRSWSSGAGGIPPASRWSSSRCHLSASLRRVLTHASERRTDHQDPHSLGTGWGK